MKKAIIQLLIFVGIVYGLILWGQWSLAHESPAIKAERAEQRERDAHKWDVWKPPAPETGQSIVGDIKKNCTLLYLMTSTKRVGDLTVQETRLIRNCEALGLYADKQ